MELWQWLIALDPFVKLMITGAMMVLIVIVLFVGKK